MGRFGNRLLLPFLLLLMLDQQILDTSKNVLNFCMEACWVCGGSARPVVAV